MVASQPAARRMKAAPFDYLRPHSVEEACACLAADADATIIAGGQTLVPMMAMRLARPSRLIDIARIGELQAFVTRALQSRWAPQRARLPR
jgi:CO/xanthine dehydrogenase FAD-binding subunit